MIGRLSAGAGALLAAIAVALEAWMAHSSAAQAALPLWQMVLSQQKGIALGLLVVGLAQWGKDAGRNAGRVAAGAWALASVGFGLAWLLFCVNIALRLLWPEVAVWQTLRAAVPAGGALHILAWLCVALGFLRAK